MANVKFYSGGGRSPLGGQIDEIPYITAKPGQLNTIASARYGFAAKMVEALMDKREADMKRKDRAQHMAAATTKGFDPSKMAPMEEESPYVAAQRATMAQALAGTPPSNLGGLEEAGDVSRFFRPEGGTESLFGADPSIDPAMQAALLGDVGTRAEDEAAYLAEQKAAHIGPREAMRNLTPQTDYGKDLQYEYELGEMERDRALQVAEEERQREADLLVDERAYGIRLKGTGTPTDSMTVKTVPDTKYPSGFGYRDLRTGDDLGESPAPRKATQITVGGSGELTRGYRFTDDGAEFIKGGSEDPEVISAQELAKKQASLNIDNKEKLPGRRGGIYADHLNAPTFKTSIDRAIKLSESSFSSGLAQQVFSKIALPEIKGVNFGAAYDLENALDAVKANVGFDELIRIKDAGGTLGALSEMENKLLQAMQGAIVAAEDPSVLIPALKKVQEIYTLNLQQKKNEFNALYPNERKPWSPPPGSGITQQEWDEMSSEDRESME